MRILLVSQHFPPENSGNASRVGDMAEKLAAAGAEVTVLAPHPTFPTGRFPRVWRWSRASARGRVRLVNLWAWQPLAEDPGFPSRVAYYLTFPLHAALWTLARARRFDVVIASTPPVFTGIAGLLPRLLRRRLRLVVEVRDLWIDAAVSLGFVREGSLFTRATRAVERAALSRADLVAVTTPDVARKLRDRYGLASARVEVVPNGVDTTRFSPVAGDKRPQFVYAGNVGHAQDLEVAIRALAILRASHPEARLVIAGDGDTRVSLERFARAQGLAEDAVAFPGLLPREQIPRLFADSVAGLAPLRRLPTLEYAVPTKAYEYLACGLPFVGTGAGEIERLARESGGGLMAEATPEAVAAAMRRFLDDPAAAAEMGKRGRAYVVERFDRGEIARAYLRALDETLKTNRTG